MQHIRPVLTIRVSETPKTFQKIWFSSENSQFFSATSEFHQSEPIFTENLLYVPLRAPTGHTYWQVTLSWPKKSFLLESFSYRISVFDNTTFPADFMSIVPVQLEHPEAANAPVLLEKDYWVSIDTSDERSNWHFSLSKYIFFFMGNNIYYRQLPWRDQEG